MGHRFLTGLVVLLAIVVGGVFHPLEAGQRVPSPDRSTVRRGTANAPRGTTALLIGQVLNADRSPLASARVRLRNLDSGAFVGQTSANHVGQFDFLVSARGRYVVEVFDGIGRVLAAGELLTVEPGQTVATIVVLPDRPPSVAALFGNSAAAIMSAAAGAGILAVGTTGQPLSPER